MNMNFMIDNRQKRTILSLFIALLAFIAITHQLYAADEEKWQKISESNYADILELIALRSKANYEEISSWQGKMNIYETNHYYGLNAAKMGDVDKDNAGRNSQHIFEEIKTSADFALDPRSGKLYSNVKKPHVKLSALDLDPNKILKKGGKYVNMIAIMAPDNYMWYMPDINFASKQNNIKPGKMAFIERPEERKFNLSGDIRDPRVFFESSGEDGRMLWESLLRIKNDITVLINARVGSYPQIEILSMNTDNGIKYRILTTWGREKNSMTNYIRCMLEVDEAVGFNAIRTETTIPNGVKTISKEYTYEKIGDIYLQKTVRKEYRNTKDEITRTSEITIETTGLNKPLPEDTFSIKKLGVEEDTIVTDNIKKAEFRYKKGELVPITDPNKS